MENLQFIGGLIGLLANIPLLIGIYQNKVKQNFVAWMLWAMMDIIASTTVILQHGNFWLPLGYAIGASTVTLLLAFKKQITWTWLETLTTLLVIGCLLIWWQVGNKAATIASVTAIGIASIPQIVATIKDPASTPTLIYAIFAIANLLSFVGGATWSVEERLYSGVALIFCVGLTLLSMRTKKL